MKKSELKAFIKEEIKSTMNEELSTSRRKLINLAQDIGKESLLDDILDIDNKNVLDMIVDELAKMWAPQGPVSEELPSKEEVEDVTAAVKDLKDELANLEESDLSEKNIGLADLEEIGYDAGVVAFIKVFNAINFKNSPDFRAYKKGFIQGFTDESVAYGLSETVTEEEDKEPSKADLKATKGLAKAKEELAQLTKQMKSLARDYKEAEGAEKEKIVADLKKKTKLKKELEAIIDK